MAIFASYSFYTTTYGGSAIAQTSYDYYAKKASAFIDHATNELASETITADVDDELIEAIQLAACAVAEQIQRNEQGGAVQSERVGSYSVSYVETPAKQLSEYSKVIQAMKPYLGNSGLMYRGV